MKICEIFYSIQGEGIDAGLPTVFVRAAGCNLNCRWCDTEYAKSGGIELKIDDILSRIATYGVKRVCITGGEPLLQIDETLQLIQSLLDRHYHVSVETNGSMDIRPLLRRVKISMDIKTPSSAMEEEMLFENIWYLLSSDQLKFVIADKKDYDYALNVLKKYPPKCHVIFQPVGGVDAKWLADTILRDRLDVRIGLQMHKLIWGEKRGV